MSGPSSRDRGCTGTPIASDTPPSLATGEFPPFILVYCQLELITQTPQGHQGTESAVYMCKSNLSLAHFYILLMSPRNVLQVLGVFPLRAFTHTRLSQVVHVVYGSTCYLCLLFTSSSTGVFEAPGSEAFPPPHLVVYM